MSEDLLPVVSLGMLGGLFVVALVYFVRHVRASQCVLVQGAQTEA